MARFVAFLRGINVGGRRVKNDELCAAFVSLGFTDVSAFLASGNVIFDGSDAPTMEFAEQIEKGLRDALGYEVPTLLRTGDEVESIAERQVFSGELEGSIAGPQVAFLTRRPDDAACAKVLGLASEDDRLEFHGGELFWLPRLGLSKSGLRWASVEADLGPTTVRTKRTVDRIAARYLHKPTRCQESPRLGPAVTKSARAPFDTY